MGSSVTHVPIGKRALTGAFAVALAAPLLTGAVVPGSPQKSSCSQLQAASAAADVTHSAGRSCNPLPARYWS
jgi:hypothetical protein